MIIYLKPDQEAFGGENYSKTRAKLEFFALETVEAVNMKHISACAEIHAMLSHLGPVQLSRVGIFYL